MIQKWSKTNLIRVLYPFHFIKSCNNSYLVLERQPALITRCSINTYTTNDNKTSDKKYK